MTRRRDELLDHEADGITEFDNDLPRWWLYGFYFTILFAAAYLVNYHLLPHPFMGDKTIAAEYDAEVKAAGLTNPRPLPPGGGAGVPVVVPLTDQASLEKGRAVFESQTNPCSACHRPDLGGLVGPNLTDDQWLHGCTAGEIVHDIQTGFPQRGMLPYGGGPALSDEQLRQVASYVLSKRGSHPPNPKIPDAERDKACR